MFYHFFKIVILLTFFFAHDLYAITQEIEHNSSTEKELKPKLRTGSDLQTASPSPDPEEKHEYLPSVRDTFIKEGNIVDLLRAVKYSSCPEHSYNHPAIQGALVFKIKNDRDPLEKALAFYLLHVALKNKNLHIQSSQDQMEFSELSQRFREISIALATSNGRNFDEQEEEWKSLYVSIPVDEKDQIKKLTIYEMNQEWEMLQGEYDRSKKYVDQAILLAKLAFIKKIDVMPDPYIRFANTPYYAEGCLAIGDCTYRRNPDYSKSMYQEALLDHNDIRGYARFIAAGGKPSELMEAKREELERMHAQLKNELLTLEQFAH